MSLSALALSYFKNMAYRDILAPIERLVDNKLTEISTIYGTWIIKSIDGIYGREFGFTVGLDYGDEWKEEALYNILAKYNNIGSGKVGPLDLTGKTRRSTFPYRLMDGLYTMNYQKWKIQVAIASTNNFAGASRYKTVVRSYRIKAYTLDPKFVEEFTKDMVFNRNETLRINPGNPTVNVYTDAIESGGWFGWESTVEPCFKKGWDRLYIPKEKKDKLIHIVNRFFESRQLYQKTGNHWNLKILLYGPGGTGKTTITICIASEYGRNIYEINDGGENGSMIPKLLTYTNHDEIQFPLFSIQDIDRFPQLVSEPDVDLNDDENTKEKSKQKQTFRAFLNAMDGIVSGNGKIIVCTANSLDEFSPILLRPGRFDLIMEIGYVCEEVFAKFVMDKYGYEIPTPFYLKYYDTQIKEMEMDSDYNNMSLTDFIEKYTSKTPVTQTSLKEKEYGDAMKRLKERRDKRRKEKEEKEEKANKGNEKKVITKKKKTVKDSDLENLEVGQSLVITE